jgi:hypothetical protein
VILARDQQIFVHAHLPEQRNNGVRFVGSAQIIPENRNRLVGPQAQFLGVLSRQNTILHSINFERTADQQFRRIPVLDELHPFPHTSPRIIAGQHQHHIGFFGSLAIDQNRAHCP